MAKVRLISLLLALTGLVACDRHAPPPPQPPPPPTIRLVAVGDILMHEDVKQAAAGRPEGLAGLWKDVTPLFQDADVGFANLETAIAPLHGRPGAPYSFNAPAELATALKASGVGLVSLANNHALDQGTKGLLETMEHLEAAGVLYAGSGRTQTDAESPVFIERKGFRIAMLAFTDIFNGLPSSRPDRPWVRGFDPEEAARAVREVRSRADVVVVSVHWGNEYWLKPSGRQREAAAALVAAGADLILGHHPHVLEPLETVTSGGRKGVVAYSLGNFISNQDRMYRPEAQPSKAGDNRDGAALSVTFTRTPQGVVVSAVSVDPLWTENNWLDRQRGVSERTDIRVIRIAPALESARAELARLEAPQARAAASDPEELKVARQRVHVLETRLQRIREVMGPLSLDPAQAPPPRPAAPRSQPRL